MRSIIVLILMCFSAALAEPTPGADSLESFAKQVQESYEKKDGEWMLKRFYTEGVPAEIRAVQEQSFKAFWGVGDLKMISVETLRFADYKPFAAPGVFQSRKLRFVVQPTHWVVLKAESPARPEGTRSASKTQIKLEFPVFEKDSQWKVVGATYAE